MTLRTSHSYAQKLCKIRLAWEIDDNVYQGETFPVRAIHTKIIILNTTDCIRFDMLQIDF